MKEDPDKCYEINHDFTPKHSTDTGKSLSFPGHPIRHLYGKGWTPITSKLLSSVHPTPPRTKTKQNKKNLHKMFSKTTKIR